MIPRTAAASIPLALFALLASTFSATARDWSLFNVQGKEPGTVAAGPATWRGPDGAVVSFYSSQIDKAGPPAECDIASAVFSDHLELRVRSFSTNTLVKARFGLAPASDFAGRRMRLRFVASADAPVPAALNAEGMVSQEAEGKPPRHWWKPMSIVLGPDPIPIEKDREYPAELIDLTFRLDLLKPGVYCIESLDFEEAPAPQAAYAPGRNLVANGGAERGWLGTAIVGDRAARFDDSGRIELNRSRSYDRVLAPEIDGSVSHAGSHSFKLVGGPGVFGSLYFDPVPFDVGGPAVLLCHARADRPTKLRMALHVASGIEYWVEVRVGTEWAPAALRIARWGEAGPAANLYGDPAHGYASSVPVAIPAFAPPENGATVWIDDVFYTVGAMDGAFHQRTTELSARLTGHGGAILRPGEILESELTLSNLSGAPRRIVLGRRLLDWTGSEVAPDKAIRDREVLLPPGEMRRAVRVAIPEEIRGPLFLEWTLRDLEAAPGAPDAEPETATLAFGVQPAPQGPPVRRLGVNVQFGSQSAALDVMREFRIGTTRLWGPFRDWELDFGFRYARPFHEAGIRNLLVLGSPRSANGVSIRGETLLPRDRTEWFAQLSRLISDHRGEIQIYEFLNEFNIWRGRIANPDPALFADPTVEAYAEALCAFRPVLAAADPAALLAGPTTCRTDLPFIQAVLTAAGPGALDMVTEHSYRESPEVPDYEEDLALGLDLARRFGVDAWAQTEAGAIKPSHGTGPLADEAARHQASWDTRNMLIAWAAGIDHYSHFMLSPGRVGTDWNLTSLGNPDNDGATLPSPALFAFRAAADLIGDSPCVLKLPLGFGRKGWVFDRGDRRVAVLWQWRGNPAPPAATTPSIVWHDMMGSSLRDAPALEGHPIYAVSELPADRLAALLLAAWPAPAQRAASASAPAADALPVPRIPAPLRIDGDFSDWPAGVRAHPLGVRSDKLPEGPAAQARLAWDDEYLYVAVEVEKEGFHPASSTGALWKGDSVQIGFDSMRNAVPGQSGLQPDDFEYDIALFDGKPAVWRSAASLAVYDSLGKSLGLIREVSAAVVRRGRRTTYELAFPKAAVSPFQLREGATMRLDVLANIGSETGRLGYIQLAPGLGDSPKRPDLWRDIVLTPETR